MATIVYDLDTRASEITLTGVPNVMQSQLSSADASIPPQILDMDNVIPHKNGLLPVSVFQTIGAAAYRTEVAWDECKAAYCSDPRIVVCYGDGYVRLGAFAPFPVFADLINFPTSWITRCYFATVGGEQLAFAAGRLAKLLTSSYVNVTPTGLSLGSIEGICSAGNYLIAWDLRTIYWSSPTDYTDFSPSLITGAGSSEVSTLDADIMFCKSCGDGFFVFTKSGIYFARYSGNAQLPWAFTKIAEGVNCEFPTHAAISEDPNGTSYMIDSKNRRVVAFNRSSSSVVFSDIFGGIDYFQPNYIESFGDSVVLLNGSTEIGRSRTLWYDTKLRRYGSITSAAGIPVVAGGDIYFLRSGDILYLDYSYSQSSGTIAYGDSHIIFGGHSFKKGHMQTLLAVRPNQTQLENSSGIPVIAPVSAQAIFAEDFRSYDSAGNVQYDVWVDGVQKNESWLFRLTGNSHIIKVPIYALLHTLRIEISIAGQTRA